MASPASPVVLTNTSPLGDASTVWNPFSTTHAFHFCAAFLAHDTRSFCTSAVAMPTNRAISPGCGVTTRCAAFLRASRSPFPAKAFSPSASNTTGTSAFATALCTNSVVSSCVPSPGPSANTVFRAITSANRPLRIASIEIAPAVFAGSASVIYSACAAATIGCTGSAVATVTSPAPARNPAFPAIAAAPDFPRDPATTSTWPYEPLLASAALCSGNPANSSGPAQRSVPFPTSSTRTSGEPIERTTNCPQHAESTPINCPTFGAVNVTVKCARNAGPPAGSPSDGSPDGISTATIQAGRGAVALRERRFTSSIARAISPCAPPRIPVPSSASTITSADATAGQNFSHSFSLVTA